MRKSSRPRAVIKAGRTILTVPAALEALTRRPLTTPHKISNAIRGNGLCEVNINVFLAPTHLQ
ncbi:hypothetical protein TSMEX_003534 [Taenia solium]|eukprot:TsM_000150300 transcript=TsM_000150300 gene=TsM_000150300